MKEKFKCPGCGLVFWEYTGLHREGRYLTRQLHKRTKTHRVNGRESREIVRILQTAGSVSEIHLGCDSQKVSNDGRRERFRRKYG